MRVIFGAVLAAAIIFPRVPDAGAQTATPATSNELSLISKAIREYPGKNSGPLSVFAGIYDLAKSCDAQSGSQNSSALMKPVLLAGKQVIWFEGDVMVSVDFSNPDAVSRTRVRFQRDFAVEGGAVKIYESPNSDGSSRRIGFFKDMMMFDPTISDNQITYTFAKRCHNEAELLEWVRKIAQLHD